MRLLLTMFPLLAMPAFAAETAQPESAPRTKIEAFSAAHGTTIVKSYSQLGSVAGRFGSSKVTVTACHFIDASTNTKSSGVRLDVEESDTREQSSFIDADEIASLLKGLSYAASFDPATLPFRMWEVTYATRGDLRLTVFNDQSNARMLAVRSQGIPTATVYLPAEGIPKLRDLLDKAQASLAAVK